MVLRTALRTFHLACAQARWCERKVKSLMENCRFSVAYTEKTGPKSCHKTAPMAIPASQKGPIDIKYSYSIQYRVSIGA